MGFRHEVTTEQMLNLYDVSLGWHIIVLFYGIMIGAVILGTILPLAYITRLKPKKILL